jgi:hypothetical protein
VHDWGYWGGKPAGRVGTLGASAPLKAAADADSAAWGGQLQRCQNSTRLLAAAALWSSTSDPSPPLASAALASAALCRKPSNPETVCSMPTHAPLAVCLGNASNLCSPSGLLVTAQRLRSSLQQSAATAVALPTRKADGQPGGGATGKLQCRFRHPSVSWCARAALRVLRWCGAELSPCLEQRRQRARLQAAVPAAQQVAEVLQDGAAECRSHLARHSRHHGLQEFQRVGSAQALATRCHSE